MPFRNLRKKAQTVEEMERELQASLIAGNQILQARMVQQQEKDTEETLRRQKAQSKILRQIMGD